MDQKEAEEYLKKLEDFEKTIGTDNEDDLDLNFMSELNELEKYSGLMGSKEFLD